MSSHDFKSNIGKLPLEVHLSITEQLDSNDIFRSRYVCRLWYRIFTSAAILKEALLRQYPRSRDVRRLLAVNISEDARSWRTTFDNVLARYIALQSGRYLSRSSITLHGSGSPSLSQSPASGQLPVGHWRREFDNWPQTCNFNSISAHERLPSDSLDPFWSYDEGLLVYLDNGLRCYAIRDFESATVTPVPFDSQGCIIRRLRLADAVLIFEWAQREPYHKLNLEEYVHRHFVTAYDVSRTSATGLRVQFRSEWKLHFLGFPLSTRDVWLSTHDRVHYAVYIWQPSRSVWGEDEPIESLMVWDISTPSSYQPSSDTSCANSPSNGPSIVTKLPFSALDHLGIRQRDNVLVRGLGLDDSMIYFVEAQYAFERGPHSIGFDSLGPAPRQYIKKTGIPILGSGPPLVRYNHVAWGGGPRHDGDNFLRSARSHTLEKLMFGLAYPGRACEDHASGIRMAISHAGQPCVNVFLSDGDNISILQDPNVERWRSDIKISGDERRLITQWSNEIHIYSFDRGVQGSGLDQEAGSDIARLGLLGDWRKR